MILYKDHNGYRYWNPLFHLYQSQTLNQFYHYHLIKNVRDKACKTKMTSVKAHELKLPSSSSAFPNGEHFRRTKIWSSTHVTLWLSTDIFFSYRSQIALRNTCHTLSIHQIKKFHGHFRSCRFILTSLQF